MRMYVSLHDPGFRRIKFTCRSKDVSTAMSISMSVANVRDCVCVCVCVCMCVVYARACVYVCVCVGVRMPLYQYGASLCAIFLVFLCINVVM